MSSLAAIDQKIADYVGQLNTRQKKVILSVAKAFVEEDADKDNDVLFAVEMERRFKELESGKVKGYSWEEVKKITRTALSDIKKR